MHSRAFAATAVCAFAVAASAASADPTNAPKGGLIHANCSGQDVIVAVNGNGEFTPAHNLADTSVFIPTALDITFTFTPPGGSPQPETDTSAKKAPIRNTITCTVPLQTVFSGPQGTATIEGEVTGFWTPRKS
jgi:hypothetical protein